MVSKWLLSNVYNKTKPLLTANNFVIAVLASLGNEVAGL